MYRLPLLACLCLGCALTPAWAGDTWWQHDPATPGDWFKPANWTAGVPGPYDYAFIDNGGTAHIAGGLAQAYDLYVGFKPGDPDLLELTGGELRSKGRQYIGWYGTGIFLHSGGINRVDNLLYLGLLAGSYGLYELSGDGRLQATREYIAGDGVGLFRQTGGTNIVTGLLSVGGYQDLLGTYELSGGQLSARAENIGYFGGGLFKQSGGTNTVLEALTISSNYSESPAAYELSGGNLSVAAQTIGDRGRGLCAQTGGSNTVATDLYVARHGGDGAYTLSGDGRLAARSEYIGNQGSGEFTQTGGTNTAKDRLCLGCEAGSSGTYRLTGGELSAEDECVGQEGTALFSQIGGTNATGYLSVNKASRYELGGGTLQVAAGMNVNGEFDFAGGAATVRVDDGGWVNLSRAAILNAHQATLTVGADSLTIYPAGAHPSDLFGSFSTQGAVHESGQPLLIAAGRVLVGWGEIDGRVECAGSLGTIPDKHMNLNAGLLVQDSGDVDLGSGKLMVEDLASGITGNGSLRAQAAYIGSSGTGRFLQSGGRNQMGDDLYLGCDQAASGTYQLAGGQLRSEGNQFIGCAGTGLLSHTGGTNWVGSRLYLAYSGGTGSYELSGGGQLSAGTEHIGYEGTGAFVQSGGANAVRGTLYLGYGDESSGTYRLSEGGQLSANSEYVGHRGAGQFIQAGGSNTIKHGLYLGDQAGSQGTYDLGAGELTAEEQHIGGEGVGILRQTGGANTTEYLAVNTAGRYEFTAGTLQITAGLDMEGLFDCAGGTPTVNAGDDTLVDLSKGSVLGAGQATLAVGANSLTIYAAGAHPSDLFGSFSTLGMTHQAGQTLVVPAGQGFAGWGQVDDRVECAGTIAASPGRRIDLSKGLSISAGGGVDLGSGELIVNDTTSGLVGGASLSADRECVGCANPGGFSQTGGVNTVKQELHLGYQQGSWGAYELAGGELRANELFVGYAGTAEFTHTGGMNTVDDELHLGYEDGSFGTYTLAGDAQLRARDEYVGWAGSGQFVQVGGTNAIDSGLEIAGRDQGPGTYELSGGQLLADWERVRFRGLFLQTGGDNVVGSSLSLTGTKEFPGRYDLRGGQLGSQQLYVGDGLLSHSGGVNTIQDELVLGTATESLGTYDLSGGQLRAGHEYIGEDGAGLFSQTGGRNTADYLCISPNGRYEFIDGTLEVTAALRVAGELDCGGSDVTVNVGDNTLVDLRDGDVLNSDQAALAVGANSLTVYNTGAKPSDLFGSFETQGMTHCAGKALVVPGSKGFGGWGDIDDHVVCAGWIAATAGGGINLNGGLRVSGSGCVELRSGELTVNDTTSGISGRGSLSAAAEYVGQSGTGRFRQSGGTNSVDDQLHLGYEDGSSGTYELGGGELLSDSLFVGHRGAGLFTQTAGTNTIGYDLYLGYSEGSLGTYELGAGQLWSGHSARNAQYIGHSGTGLFVQTGGTNMISGCLWLGYERGSCGTYELKDGELWSDSESIGREGMGLFEQTGGSNTVAGSLTVDSLEGGGATYELNGGALRVEGDQHIAFEGIGLLVQTAGTNTVGGDLLIGEWKGSVGAYELSHGEVKAHSQYVGRHGTGLFRQSGGSNTVAQDLVVGDWEGSVGTYELSGDGRLFAQYEYIGNRSTAAFTQSGGVHTVGVTLKIGCKTQGSGEYIMSQGTLGTRILWVGEQGRGTLHIAGPGASISVQNMLRFGPRSTFTATPGSTIHMGAALFDNQSTDPAALAGLENLRLIFEGGPEDFARFEVAGADLGPVPAGWVDNFALGTLQLGGEAGVGQLRLVDDFDNQPGQAEALYVDSLVLNPGWMIDLNGLNLYFLNGGEVKQLFAGDINLDGAVDGLDYNQWSLHYQESGIGWCEGDFDGSTVVDGLDYNRWSLGCGSGHGAAGAAIPEPLTIVLLAVLAPLLLRRRRWSWLRRRAAVNFDKESRPACLRQAGTGPKA